MAYGRCHLHRPQHAAENVWQGSKRPHDLLVDAQQDRALAVADEGRRHRQASHATLEVVPPRRRFGPSAPGAADVHAAAAATVLQQPGRELVKVAVGVRKADRRMVDAVPLQKPEKLRRIAQPRHRSGRAADQRQRCRGFSQQFRAALEAAARDPAGHVAATRQHAQCRDQPVGVDVQRVTAIADAGLAIRAVDVEPAGGRSACIDIAEQIEREDIEAVACGALGHHADGQAGDGK